MHFILAATTTTNPSVHKGAVLPAARFIVVAVPLAAMSAYLFFVARRRGHQ